MSKANYLEIMENKLQDELAQHQNQIASLSSRPRHHSSSAKRSGSKKSSKVMEKENK